MAFYNIAAKTGILVTIYSEVIFLKKLCLILLLIFALCACSVTETPEKSSSSSSASSQVGPKVDIKITEFENFKVEKTSIGWDVTFRVFDLEGKQIGTDYESFEEILYDADFLEEKYYAATVTEGTRLDYISHDLDPYFEKVEEVPNTESWILDEYGKPLEDIPFDYYEFSQKDMDWGNEGFDAFYGFRNGDKYCYEIKDGKFVHKYTEFAGETGNEYFGYKETVAYYGLGMNVGYGVNDSDGNVIFEPFHSRIDFPCADRLIIYSGYMAHNTYPYEHIAHITDMDGIIYSSYSDVHFFDFEEGSIWIAYYVGDDSHLEKRFDKDEGYLGDGYWFIDKDGNRISPCFKSLSINGHGLGYLSAMKNEIKISADDMVKAEDENGNPVEFKLKEYIIDTSIVFLGIAEDTEVYRKTVETGKTRKELVEGKDGTWNSIAEVPEIEYWVTDKEGNPLIKHPFYEIVFFEEIDTGDPEQYRFPGIWGCYKGDFYSYIFDEGKFELEDISKAGEFEISETHKYKKNSKNYVYTAYDYGVFRAYYGLNDRSGNVILEPIFSYVPSIVFNDRIVVCTNNGSRNSGEDAFDTMIDFDGNVICNYSDIYFYHFEDGSYIGIGRYIGYGDDWGHILRDKNGELLETGCRFIDKNGNVLSPCFDLFEIAEFCEYFTYEEIIENHLNETVYFTDKDGNKAEITIKNYICNQQ